MGRKECILQYSKDICEIQNDIESQESKLSDTKGRLDNMIEYQAQAWARWEKEKKGLN